MGYALDAIGFKRTAGGGGVDAAFVASVVSPGDSFTVRNFNPQTRAFLDDILGQFVTAGAQYRVRSPLFHDNVQGIRLIPGETPIRYSLPRQGAQMLRPQDNLTVEQISNLASEVCAGALLMWYEDMPGAAARLHTSAEVLPLIKNIKPMLVAAPEAGTTGQWLDTVITVSEDLLKANTDYAVMGFATDIAECAIGIKGPDTGNLRACAPGDVRTINIESFFADQSDKLGVPYIPIINSANKGATFVSVLSQTTAHTPNVQVMLAELSRNLS